MCRSTLKSMEGVHPSEPEASRAADRARLRVAVIAVTGRTPDAAGCGRIPSARLRWQVERVMEQQNSSCTGRATQRLRRVKVDT